MFLGMLYHEDLRIQLTLSGSDHTFHGNRAIVLEWSILKRSMYRTAKEPLSSQ